MPSLTFLYPTIFTLFYFSYSITAQNHSTLNNNGDIKTCQSYLIYQTRLPYNTLSSIALIFSVNASQISQLNNNISENTSLGINTEVIVPVTLSNCGLFLKKKWRYFWTGVSLGVAAFSVISFIFVYLLLRRFDLIARKH